MATAGQRLLNAAGERILTTDGLQRNSDGTDECVASDYELFTCATTPVATGIGVTNADIAAAPLDWSGVVTYLGGCYSIGTIVSDPVTHISDTITFVTGTGCLEETCRACDHCDPDGTGIDTTPDPLAVTFASVGLDPTCLTCVGVGGTSRFKYNQASWGATFSVPFQGRGYSANCCRWHAVLDVTGGLDATIQPNNNTSCLHLDCVLDTVEITVDRCDNGDGTFEWFVTAILYCADPDACNGIDTAGDCVLTLFAGSTASASLTCDVDVTGIANTASADGASGGTVDLVM